MPPEVSVAYLFSGLQSELRFPFTVVQNFSSVDFARMSRGLLGLTLREKMAARHAPASRERGVRPGGQRPDGRGLRRQGLRLPLVLRHRSSAAPNVHELESRVDQDQHLHEAPAGQRRAGGAGEPRAGRAGDAAGQQPVRPALQRGDQPERRGPGHGLSAVRRRSRRRSCCSAIARAASTRTPCSRVASRAGARRCSVRRGPGKSVMLQSFLLGNAAYPSQGYVIDRGNSFGPLFELLSRESPEEVAVMRFQGGAFQFNPLPLVWALEEKARQIAAGTYQMALEDGTRVPCPVADAKVFFEAWLEGLVGQGEMLSDGPEEPARPGAQGRLRQGRVLQGLRDPVSSVHRGAAPGRRRAAAAAAVESAHPSSERRAGVRVRRRAVDAGAARSLLRLRPWTRSRRPSTCTSS